MNEQQGSGSRVARRWIWGTAGIGAIAVAVVAFVVVSGLDGDEAGGAVSDVDEVAEATVRITTEGTYAAPALGAGDVGGGGTGFFVSEDGLIVASHHVVAGAESIDVAVPGIDEPFGAQVVGLSECADLAVLSIAAEREFPFVDWTRAEPSSGLDVFAFGYPADSDEVVRSRGVVSVARAEGDSRWASSDNTLAHTAVVETRGAGGPLALSDGRILGVNYEPDGGDRVAVSHVEAREVIEALAGGDHLHSIGVNGQAVLDDASGVSGIWVAAVVPRSPAARTGIEPGDLITRIEGVSLGGDGTKAQYCDVLRSHEANAVLAVEVLRLDSGEVFEGQINGDRLEPSFSFAQTLGDAFAEPSDDVPDTHSEFVTVVDDTGAISVEVPVEWGEVDGRPLVVDEGDGRPNIRAAPSLEGFETSFAVPGVNVSLFADAGPSDADELLDAASGALEASCANVTRQPYDDARLRGSFDEYTGCGDKGSSVVVVVAGPEDGGRLVRVLIQVVTRTDLGALDTILDTVVVDSERDG